MRARAPPPRAAPSSQRGPADQWLELEEHLPELDRLRVLGMHTANDSLHVRFHLVHELHGLQDAEGLAWGYDVADLVHRRRSRLRSAVEGADHRRLDAHECAADGV